METKNQLKKLLLEKGIYDEICDTLHTITNCYSRIAFPNNSRTDEFINPEQTIDECNIDKIRLESNLLYSLITTDEDVELRYIYYLDTLEKYIIFLIKDIKFTYVNNFIYHQVFSCNTKLRQIMILEIIYILLKTSSLKNFSEYLEDINTNLEKEITNGNE